LEHLRRLFIIFALSVALLATGTAGYVGIEGWHIKDATYMTVITLATVGYSEVHPLSDPGRIFTMVLLLLGVGFTFYVIGYIVRSLVEGRILTVLGRRGLEWRISHLRKHYIICGYGRIGRVLSRFLRHKQLPLVIIEQNEERIPTMQADGVPYILGDADNESILTKAGINRAKGLLGALGTDAANVVLTLLARRMNPDLFVVMRASQNETKKTLLAAGVNKVISPYDLGARRMAHAVLRPTVIHFLELAFADEGTDIAIEECAVGKGSHLVGVCLRDSQIRQDLNLIVISMRKASGEMHFNPSAETCLEVGDILVVVGENRHLQELEQLLNP